MLLSTPRATRWLRALCLPLLLMSSVSVLADAPLRTRSAPPAVYAQECGSCHMAYPPGLLPAASWQRLMSGLARHFGSNATLDADSQAAITRWLLAEAATSARLREEPAQDRISRAAWFQREHREVASATWSRASVRSPSSCNACHPRAEQGNFDEHAVRIPR